MQVNKISQDEVEIKLGQNLDVTNSNELKNLLMSLAGEGCKKVRLDFGETENIDSSGLGKILFFSDLLQQRNGCLKIMNVRHHSMQDLFKLINLEKVISIEFK